VYVCVYVCVNAAQNWLRDHSSSSSYDIVIIISKLLKRHSKAKHRAPAYSQALLCYSLVLSICEQTKHQCISWKTTGSSHLYRVKWIL